jgi:AcrR family transcriptional regulator
MANIGHGKKFEEAKSQILHTAAKMFLESGYQNTTMAELAKAADVSYGKLFRVFNDKEEILCELVSHVLERQFETTKRIVADKTDDKFLFYAAETTLQLYMAESSEHIREMYSVSYSLPRSSDVVYQKLTTKLEDIFKEHRPELETKDFYELEIASGGIMRGFITVPCNMYFTMDRKVKRFLEATFLVWRVPDGKINEAIEFVSQFDFKTIASETLDSLFDYLESRT